MEAAMRKAPAVVLSFIFTVAATAGEWTEVGPEGGLIDAAPAARPAEDRHTVPRGLYVEPSTLHSLGFEWTIEGDANRSGRVAVAYRKTGEEAWREGHDLLRIHGERVGLNLVESGRDWTCGNLYAGSVLFLEPGTRYDVRLVLTDPDQAGVVAEHRLRVATKSVPRLPTGGRTRDVRSDAELAATLGDAQPGDVLMLHSGTYRDTFAVRCRGTRERPIVVRDAGDGPVVFTDSGKCFEVDEAAYVWLQGLVFRGCAWPIHAGEQAATKGLTVVRCRFEDNDAGILIRSTACRDFYIADNVFVGTTGMWHRDEGKRKPYKAMRVAGQGIDVCYNRVRNHWDGLSTWGSKPTRDPRRKLSAVDFYHNDVGQIVDDNEADYGQHNIRFWRNRIVDMHVGLSAQPVYGGPCWFVRNVQYNITRGVAFKLNCQPAGVLAYNNTSVSSGHRHGKGVAGLSRGWSNVRVLNNLFLGVNGATLTAGPFDPGISRLDYNGYSVVEPLAIHWFVHPEVSLKGAKLKVYESFEAFARETGNERHRVEVTFDDLVRVEPPRGEEVTNPLAFGDPRLREGSKAVDAGMVIPNITDGYRGKAPDLGAHERGDPLPHYGPRPTEPARQPARDEDRQRRLQPCPGLRCGAC
jgi:hypothetical protein